MLSSSSRRRSRQLSCSDVSAPNSPVLSHSRRSSQYSPITRRSSYRFSGDLSGFQGNGMENLADELADVWALDEGVDESISEVHGHQAEDGDERNTDIAPDGAPYFVSTLAKDSYQSASNPKTRLNHFRTGSQLDISKDDGGADEDARDGISLTLHSIMKDIENLANEGAGTWNDGSQDETITRGVESLRDLGAQSGIEIGAARLATAHRAVSTNLTNQTRALQSVSYVLLSPLSYPLDEASIDELLPLVMSSISSLPHPSIQALSSLKRLSHESREIVSLLSNLSDSLHISRQITDTAARRLKSTRELIAELRKEDVAYEKGLQWIDDGRWQMRLAERDCARVCKDVVGGFEEVCDGWRKRLVASATVGVA